MLRDPNGERARDQKSKDISDYLIERGYGRMTMKLVAAELMAGKVPHVGLK